MVELLLEQAAMSGFAVAFVRVAPQNAAALRCYRRSGFVEMTPSDQQRFTMASRLPIAGCSAA